MNKTRIYTLSNGYHLWTRTQNIGEKTKMITVHGGPGETSESFERFGEYLSPLGIEVTRYDQLGSFYSDQPDFENNPNLTKKYLNIDYFVEELEELRVKLSYEKFILVGYSWGGMIAQEYALRYAKNLSALAIISMTAREQDYGDALLEYFKNEFNSNDVDYVLSHLNKKNFNDEKTNEILGEMFSMYFESGDYPRVKHFENTSNNFIQEYMLGKNPFETLGSLKGWNVENRLNEINIPTFLSYGENDLFAEEKMKLQNKSIKNSELFITPKGNHLHLKEYPEIFFKEFINWLQKNGF